MNWPFWVELLVRSGALLLAGEALRRVSRASSAAFRHRLLLWVFFLLALLPVLSVVFPEIPISLWRPAHELRGYVTTQEGSSRMLITSAHHMLNWPLVVWLAGVAVACVPLFVGGISAWRIARRSTTLQNAELTPVVQGLAGETEVLISNAVRVPVTCGLVRPRILLPESAERWSTARMAAVLLHELAHIRRRDLAAQMGAHLVAALWWFQPLVWVLRSGLRAESEFACDAEALRSGLRASEYAAELLGVAQSIGRDWSLPSSAIGMVRRCDLEKRLRAILHPPTALLRSRRVYVVGFALGAISIAASAVSLGSSQSESEQGGSMMKRTILSALLTSAGLTAATVSGYIHDSSGAAVADAKVLIVNPDSSVRQAAVTGADGKFSFSGTDEGQYILRIEKPGLATIFRVFDLKADSGMDRNFTMAAEGAPAPADRSSSPDATSKPVRVGGQVAESNLVSRVQPVYPASAKKAGIQGTVELDVTISKEGVPLELRVVSSPSDDLSESALDAVRQWRYRPTLLNGQPIEVETTVIVNYTLSK